MDFYILRGPLSALELSCVEMVDILCTCAYMQFDLNYVHFPHMSNLKWIYSNVKTISEYILAVLLSWRAAYMHPSLFKRTVSIIKLQRCILMNKHFNS